MNTKNILNKTDEQQLLQTLYMRFTKHMHRHKTLQWQLVEAALLKQKIKLWSIQEMEKTGGEPDVINFTESTQEYMFIDCSKESPSGRRSLCYDAEALATRKEFKPINSAVELATTMGVSIATEQQYRTLQAIEIVDTKTSSWLLTPAAIRHLGGSIFGDYRYGQVFVYHNGAQSYYGSRGFRTVLFV